MVEAWNESLFANFPPAEEQRPRIVEARQRVQLLDRLRHFIQSSAGKISLAGEKGLAASAARLPQGYQHGLQERVELARRRVKAFAKLEKRLNENTSETAIVAAWKAIVDAKCEQFVSLEWGMRIAVAEERLPVFRALAKITEDLPVDQRDQRVLALWKEKLMADCPEADSGGRCTRWRPCGGKCSKRLQASVDAHDDAGRGAMGQQALPGELSLAATTCRGDCRRPPATGPQRIAAGGAGQCGGGDWRRRN